MGISHFKRSGRDGNFLIFEQLDIDRVLSYEPYRHLSRERLAEVLEAGRRFAAEVMGPTNQDGDRIGCVRDGGRVTVPPSFHGAWQKLAQQGWLSLGSNPAFGGGGMPQVINGLVGEYLTGANLALSIYGGLSVAAGRVIENFGTDRDRELFVHNLYSGRWAGTMCLTEPEAGSDVGWLTSRAAADPEAEDRRIHLITGHKRFISGGEQDLTGNIIHLVLARIQGAPQGTKGISIFIVPKVWVEPGGSLGGPNGVACVGIEDKMGVHGSATCALRFGQEGPCRGILLGEPQTGMAKMFQMMNEARMYTGLMGLSLAASAYDTARLYAAKRVQGPPFVDRKAKRVPIIRHEDVRRMLLGQKAGTEAMRALIARTYVMLDASLYDPDPKLREKAKRQVELMTPVIKGYCTDAGYMLIRDAIQVLGGNGYCSQFPAEQYARDAKVLSVWEGTSYIQALDLVGRKLPRENGTALREALDEVKRFCKKHRWDRGIGSDCRFLLKAARATASFPLRYLKFLMGRKKQIIALTATRFSECLAEVMMAKLLLEQAVLAGEKLASGGLGPLDQAFYQGKISTAQFFCRNTLPGVFARQLALEKEDLSALEIPDEAFAQ